MRRNALVVSPIPLLTLGLQPKRCTPSSGAQLARGASLVDARTPLVVTSAADSGPGTLRRALLDARPVPVGPGAEAPTLHCFSLPNGGYLLSGTIRCCCVSARSGPSLCSSPWAGHQGRGGRAFWFPGGRWTEASR